MKTISDILTDYPGAEITATGSGQIYTCIVKLYAHKVIGYGSTVENAIDTAWCGVTITLRDK